MLTYVCFSVVFFVISITFMCFKATSLHLRILFGLAWSIVGLMVFGAIYTGWDIPVLEWRKLRAWMMERTAQKIALLDSLRTSQFVVTRPG